MPSEQTIPIESTASPDFNFIIDNLVFEGHCIVLVLGPFYALRTLFVACTVVLTYLIVGTTGFVVVEVGEIKNGSDLVFVDVVVVVG